MKKLAAILTVIVMLFASAALAEDLSAMTEDELKTLLLDVTEELERRYNYSRETVVDTVEDEMLTRRVLDFYSAWYANSLDDMLAFCDPEWRAAQEQDRTALFAILANRTPVSCEVFAPGDETGGVRRLTVTALMDRHNGMDPVYYRHDILMKKADDGQWYLDPRCLLTWEIADGFLMEEPTPEPYDWSADDTLQTTLMYYVPNGGEKYHLNQFCPSVNEKFLPMQGCFTYWELNMDEYKNLQPCNVCGAPGRELAPTDLPYFLLKIYDRSGIENLSYLRADYYVGNEKRGYICSCPDEGEDFYRFPLGAGTQEELKDLRVEFSYGVSDLSPEDAILEAMKGNTSEEYPLLTMDFIPEGEKTYWLSLEPSGEDSWKLVPADAE